MDNYSTGDFLLERVNSLSSVYFPVEVYCHSSERVDWFLPVSLRFVALKGNFWGVFRVSLAKV